MKKSILFLIASCCCCILKAQNITKATPKKIIINLEMPQDILSQGLLNTSKDDSVELQSISSSYIDIYPEWDKHKEKFSENNHVKWELYATNPLQIRSSFLGNGMFFNPGDSISIKLLGKTFTYSGKGMESLKLQEAIRSYQQSLVKPTKNHVRINSVEDYLNWKKYLDSQLAYIIPLIDSYKTSISPSIYELIKIQSIERIEFQRAENFAGLYNVYAKNKNSGLTAVDLATICDSTLNSSWAQWLRSRSNYNGNIWYFYQYSRIQVWKRFGFDFDHDSLNTSDKRRLLYYSYLKQNFKGQLRERLLEYLVAVDCIKGLGLGNSVTQIILNDYYIQPGFSEYKQWVKAYESKASKIQFQRTAPDFQLVKQDGNIFGKDNLKGKIALIDFWFTGCQPCVEMTSILRSIEDVFKNDSNVVFVSVSTDKDKNRWLKSLEKGLYTTGNAINVFTGGQGKDHPMLSHYFVSGYPELHLINAEGKIVQFPLPNPRTDVGKKELINLISKESEKISLKMHSLANDGPYIFFNKDSVAACYIINNKPTIKKFASKILPTFKVHTDKARQEFDVVLKSKLEIERSEYTEPGKLLVLSDVEGNFDALRKLLQSNNVIDDNFNWIYGAGHLVFLGDMFDRGLQVTECLWLIYTLEEKAKKAGGYLHFVLGNHEIMNLQGDHKYTKQKYKDNAALLGKTLAELYNERTEIGKWLRTKNVIEKIGNLLFTHGGISREINKLPITIDEINQIARNLYDVNKKDYGDEKANLIMSWNGPFWFRGYYANFPMKSVIDSTLQKFNVKWIVTGHTIVADTISVHYEGKLVNTDTQHAKGKSEALLIEDNRFYRVTTDGERMMLFRREDLQ